MKHAPTVLIPATCIALAMAMNPAMADARESPQAAMASQPLGDALQEWAVRNGKQLIFDADLAAGKQARGIAPELKGIEALSRLLDGTGLSYRVLNERTISILPAGAAGKEPAKAGLQAHADSMRLAQAQPRGSSVAQTAAAEVSEASAGPADTKGIPEILVQGRKSLNTDMERTEDSPQPYVVFGKEEIRRSQAASLDDFFRTRLPMNSTSASLAQGTGDGRTNSLINLRGLGWNQTLILVDGRRMPNVSSGGFPLQPDVNGIPLAAIERIEVLPSTAGGIYGGNATGGVINIILDRSFRGVELNTSYTTPFDTDASTTRVDVNGGFSLEEGRTQVTVSASYATTNTLTVGDRDFARRAIQLQMENNPASVLGSSTPPWGGTANIRSSNGSNLTLDPIYGGTNLGFSNTYLPLGYAGAASDNGAALVRNAGKYNLELPAGLGAADRGLVAVPSMESAQINLRREFGQRIEAFADVSTLGNHGESPHATFLVGSISNLSAGAPNNPFQQNINVRFPTPGLTAKYITDYDTVRATGGVIARLPRNWTGELDYAWSRSRGFVQSTAFLIDSVGSCVLGRGVAANVDPDGAGPLTPCAAGDTRPALNALQEGNTLPIDFTPYQMVTPNSFSDDVTFLTNTTLRLSGPAMTLPGGALTLSALIERRKEKLQDTYTRFLRNTGVESFAYHPVRTQKADSFYAEASAPLISPANARPFAHRLDLQISARHDRYQTRSTPTGSTAIPSPDGPFPTFTYTTATLGSTDYTIGLSYSPVEDITLRVSQGTGFLAPSVAQVAPRSGVGNGGTDPQRGDSPIGAFSTISGGSPDLKPEESSSLSAGFILTPRFVPGFRLSVDYTRIKKVDEIVTPDWQFLLDNEARFPGRIVRGDKLPNDPPAYLGVVTLIDWTYLNIARTRVEAYDIQADYVLQTRQRGSFSWYAVATAAPEYRNRALPTIASVDKVGFSDGVLKWRGNLGMNWDQGAWSVGWNAQYYHSYLVYSSTASPASALAATLNQGGPLVPSQIYHDLIATYRIDPGARFAGGWLADSQIMVGVRNVLNTSPPILASSSLTSPGYSTYGDPLMRRYSVSLQKNFR